MADGIDGVASVIVSVKRLFPPLNKSIPIADKADSMLREYFK